MSYGNTDYGLTHYGDPPWNQYEVSITAKKQTLVLDAGVSDEDLIWTDDGYIGWGKRGPAATDVLETFCEFDVPSVLPLDAIIVDTQVRFDVDNTGNPTPNKVDSNIYEQNRVSNATWNGSGRPPWYSDFGTTAWSNELSTVQEQVKDNNKTYLFGTKDLNTIVNDWKTGTKDYKDGLIIDVDVSSKIYEWHITDIQMKVVYRTQQLEWLPYYLKSKKKLITI